MPANTIHFDGADFFMGETDLSPELFAALELCGHSGDQSETVQSVRVNFDITGDPEECREYLRGFGAWEDSDLADHDTNIDRLLWLAGGQLYDGQTEIYFSAY